MADTVLDRFTVIPHLVNITAYKPFLQALAVCGYKAESITECGRNGAAVFPSGCLAVRDRP
ncbi:MAG: hypothetical protein ACP5NF_06530 [Thermoanaerobaculum sp.]